MRRVVQDRAAPDVDRQRTLHEAIAQRFRSVGLAIPFTARVIAADMKPIAVELVEPPFDRDLPVRMLPEKSADDTEPDRLVPACANCALASAILASPRSATPQL